jgi:RNA polymerase sigma-70 factor, ECF subfamily
VSRRLSEQAEQDDLARSSQGDGEAYARIVAGYQSQVARRMWLFARQPEVVEELVQEVFVEAYFSLSKFRAEGPFAAWLTRIATRVGYRHWKRRHRVKEVVRDDSWWRDLKEQEVEQLDPARAGRLVHGMLEELPPRDRLVLLLMYVEGRSVEESAALAGWSKTMVKVQAFRARRKLRAMFEARGIDSVEAALDSAADGARQPSPSELRTVAREHDERV